MSEYMNQYLLYSYSSNICKNKISVRIEQTTNQTKIGSQLVSQSINQLELGEHWTRKLWPNILCDSTKVALGPVLN